MGATCWRHLLLVIRRRICDERDAPAHHPRLIVDLFDEVNLLERDAEARAQARHGVEIVGRHPRIARVRQREMWRVRTSARDGERDGERDGTQ